MVFIPRWGTFQGVKKGPLWLAHTWHPLKKIKLTEISLFFRDEDLYQVPSSMLVHWQKRLKRLSNVMSQVKTKQCKTVMAVLMTARSKLMRKWKVFDAGWGNNLIQNFWLSLNRNISCLEWVIQNPIAFKKFDSLFKNWKMAFC